MLVLYIYVCSLFGLSAQACALLCGGVFWLAGFFEKKDGVEVRKRCESHSKAKLWHPKKRALAMVTKTNLHLRYSENSHSHTTPPRRHLVSDRCLAKNKTKILSVSIPWYSE